MFSHNWYADIRQRGVLAIAQAFGNIELVHPNSPRYGLTPCPACGATTRHTKRRDRRGAIGITPNGLGWRCFQCEIGGDAVTLASWLCGQQGRIERILIEACKGVGLLPHFNCDTYLSRRVPRVKSKLIHPKLAPQSPNYPPADELHALLGQARPIDPDPKTEIGSWLKDRGINPTRIANLSTAVALPKNAKIPNWASFGKTPWTKTGHRLLVHLYDCNGNLRSVHGRQVTNIASKCKSLSPSGYAVSGLIMCCPLARITLQHGRTEEGKAVDEHLQRLSIAGSHRVGLVICEGVPDWLTQYAFYKNKDPDVPAIMGILSGSWTKEHANKIPDGCTVLVATHNDGAGDKYAEHIRQTFAGRKVTLRRWKAKTNQ